MNNCTHVGFSDESHHNFGRYRGIGLVSLSAENREDFETEIGRSLQESGLREFKWSDLSSAQHRFAALKIVNWVFDKMEAQGIRIDVLTWDTQDSRHTIQGRDDAADLARMYYHLFKNVLCERWPDGSRWTLFPDEQSAIDWQKMDEVLHNVSSNTELQRDLSEQGKLKLKLKTEFSIFQICPSTSHDNVLVPVSDLFVGLGVYSRTSYDCYEAWLLREGLQSSFSFQAISPSKERSRSDKARCAVISHLDDRCKKSKLGVSLKSSRGFRTLNPISSQLLVVSASG